MHILFLIQNFCYRLFYGQSTYQAKQMACCIAQSSIPSHVVTKMQVHCPIQHQAKPFVPPQTRPLVSRAISHPIPVQSPIKAPQTSSFIPYYPVTQQHIATQQQIFTQKANNLQVQDSLSQSLQNQIHQLEGENKSMLANIAIKRSENPSFKSIHSSSELTCNDNVKKHAELDSLNDRLEKISDFCNQEMMDILDFVMESSKTLHGKLAKLRQETPLIEDDALLCENVEHIVILENALEALQQVEAKFQEMQKKADQPLSPSSQNTEETHINSLLEKIEGLNKQKQFLEGCKQSLPAHAAYDCDELQKLMQLFENDSKELSQKTKETRQQLNKAENFAHEMTNHLLDYTEIFKSHFQKLQYQARIVNLPTPTPLQAVITHVQPQTYTITPAPVALQAQILTPPKKEKSQAHDLVAAAADLAAAIKDLVEVV